MITLNVTDREGVKHSIQAPVDMGLNVMEILKAEGFPVEGTCGGMALCASCQCYIKSDHPLPELSYEEEEMLDQAFYVQANSRLGCQIQLTKEINNLELEIAPESE